ncbi:MAG: hypothetical protein ACK514_08705, partial [Bacteroidota bacterium]
MLRYLILVFLFCAVYYLTEHLLITDEIVYSSFIDRLSYDRISEILANGKKWQWLHYAFLPIILFIKIAFVATCLSIGGLIINIDAGFKKFASIAITAEFVFLITHIIKLLWFCIVKVNYTLQDLQFFSPLSMISLFNPTELDPWLVYPIQLLNVFELLYWIALAWQLQEVLEKPFAESLGFVAKTYGVG